MSAITKETRKESYQQILKNLGERQQQVFLTLSSIDEPVTANELAFHMYIESKFKTPDRNNVHPRLNELVKLGVVSVVGKRVCSVTSKKCAIYKITQNEQIIVDTKKEEKPVDVQKQNDQKIVENLLNGITDII